MPTIPRLNLSKLTVDGEGHVQSGPDVGSLNRWADSVQTALTGLQNQVTYVNNTVQSVTIPPQPYDVVFSPNAVLNSSREYFIEVFTRSVVFPINFAGSIGRCINPPGTAQTLTINRNGTAVGSIAISTAGAFSFSTSTGATVGYNTNDYLSITNQAGADGLMILQLTLSGTR